MEEELNPVFSDKAKRDLELVAAAEKGDQKAYAELMDLYHDAIYFMLLKMVNNKSDAEDLTIEAFGKAFKNLHLYTPNFAFSTWLFKIASNNCIDFLRRKRVMQKHISIDTPSDEKPQENIEAYVTLQSSAPDPEEHFIIKQKQKELKTIVDKMNPRYRQLIELRYFKEYSYVEIAEELALPIGTVKARLYRSRMLLFNVLKEKEGEI